MLNKIINHLVFERQKDLKNNLSTGKEWEALDSFMEEHLEKKDIAELEPLLCDYATAQEEQWYRIGFMDALRLKHEIEEASTGEEKK